MDRCDVVKTFAREADRFHALGKERAKFRLKLLEPVAAEVDREGD
jgi:hypothetical protein